MTEPNHQLTPWAQPPAPPAPGVPFQPPRELKELEYHRLSHADSRTRWWSPLAEGALGALFFLIFSVAVGFAYAGYVMASGGGASDLTLSYLQTNSLKDPAIFLLMFGSIVVMFPSLLLARLIVGPRPWGLVHSVAARLRWSWLALCMGIAIVLYVMIPVVVQILSGEPLQGQAHISASLLMWMMGLVFVVVPVQCYAEELVFRGYLMQAIGRWLKHPAWTIIIPAPLFMLGHDYTFWGQASILVMGLAAGFMAWYTGGLEAGIAMHVVNNLYLMVMGVLGMVDPFAQEGSSVGDFLWATALELLLVLVVAFAARKVGIARSAVFDVVISPKRWKQLKTQQRASSKMPAAGLETHV